MPKLICKKFRANDDGTIFYRQEINRGKEVVFAIALTDLTMLGQGYDDVDFDAKSDAELSDARKTSLPANLYFQWVEADFFPCQPEEIRYSGLK